MNDNLQPVIASLQKRLDNVIDTAALESLVDGLHVTGDHKIGSGEAYYALRAACKKTGYDCLSYIIGGDLDTAVGHLVALVRRGPSTEFLRRMVGLGVTPRDREVDCSSGHLRGKV